MGPKKDSNGKKKGPKSDGIDPGPTDNVNNVNNTGVEGPIPMEISPAKTPAKMDDGNVDMVTPAKPINKNNPSPEDKTSLNKRKNSGNVTAVTGKNVSLLLCKTEFLDLEILSNLAYVILWQPS